MQILSLPNPAKQSNQLQTTDPMIQWKLNPMGKQSNEYRNHVSKHCIQQGRTS